MMRPILSVLLALVPGLVGAQQPIPQGNEFQVNTYTPSHQFSPEVSTDGADGFVVSWISDGSGGTDSSAYSIQGQRFALGGSPAGSEFQINTYTTSNQFDSAGGPNGAGGFVVTWTSLGSNGSDTDGSSTQAQRYALPEIFEDGFESGNTSAWSQVVP